MFVSENPVSEDLVSENPVSEDLVSENPVSENLVSENHVPKKFFAEISYRKPSSLRDFLSKNHTLIFPQPEYIPHPRSCVDYH